MLVDRNGFVCAVANTLQDPKDRKVQIDVDSYHSCCQSDPFGWSLSFNTLPPQNSAFWLTPNPPVASTVKMRRHCLQREEEQPTKTPITNLGSVLCRGGGTSKLECQIYCPTNDALCFHWLCHVSLHSHWLCCLRLRKFKMSLEMTGVEEASVFAPESS